MLKYILSCILYYTSLIFKKTDNPTKLQEHKTYKD